MASVLPGRMTHRYDGELVVFMIGMRINRWHRPDQWMPVFRAMPPMLRELEADPDSGLLGFRTLVGGRGPTLVQYWDSHEKLYAYASNPTAEHRPAWRAFNQLLRESPGAVGVWHETYQVDRAETVYVATPVMGLASVTTSVAVGSRSDRAAERYDQGETPRTTTQGVGR